MKNKKSKFIGVDVGGTKILLQSFDEKMNIVAEEKVFTEVKKGQIGFKKQLISLIQKYFHSGIRSIGVALPGIVDQKSGVLVEAPHLPVKNFPIRKILQTKFKCPVAVDNDVNAFLCAQHNRQILKKYKNIIAVMIGTGVGGSIIVKGEKVTGKQCFAGEVGHMILRRGHKLDTFEKNTSGFFIPQIARDLAIVKPFITSDLSKNSPASKKVKRHLVEFLGIGLANLNLIFNPEVFVMGGSIYKHFLKDSKKELQKIIAQYALDQKTPLILDADQKHTAALGVALMSARS